MNSLTEKDEKNIQKELKKTNGRNTTKCFSSRSSSLRPRFKCIGRMHVKSFKGA